MHDDLLAQAKTLATMDARRPKQANLRRALSAAYYALFHFLVEESCCAVIGSQHAQAPYRHVIGRAFQHATMKKACASFGGGTLKASAIKGLPRNSAGNYAIPTEVQSIAATFVELQDRRHRADYDLTERFSRSDVVTLINQVCVHIDDFKSLAVCDDRKFFLAALWAWNELLNR